MAEASETQDETNPQEAAEKPDVSAAAATGGKINSILDWALKLSAEERGWIDGAYQPPQEVVELATRLSGTSRSFYVLTGLWGVGKSSALQYICDALADSHHKPFLLRAAPDRSILGQIVAKHVRNPTEYAHDLMKHLEIRRKLEHSDDGRFSKALDALRLQGDPFEGEAVIPKTTLHRINQKNTILELGRMDAVLLDLPDFSRTDRRPLIHMLSEVQDLWLKLMEEGTEGADEPIGPSIVITLQKELFDLAPSYFLGKANIVELKPLTAEQLIGAYRAKFPICGALDEPALDYLAHLSRGVFRRFLKFLAVVLRDAENRKLAHISLSDAMAAVSPSQVSQEMEAELAYLFPQPDRRNKAAKIIMVLLQAKYQPSHLLQYFDPNLSRMPGPFSQKQLAEMLSLTEVEVSRLMSRLVANGVVTRERVLVGKDENAYDIVRTVLRLNM